MKWMNAIVVGGSFVEKSKRHVNDSFVMISISPFPFQLALIRYLPSLHTQQPPGDDPG